MEMEKIKEDSQNRRGESHLDPIRHDIDICNLFISRRIVFHVLMCHSIRSICPVAVAVMQDVGVNTVDGPYHSFHSAHQLLGAALPGVDGRGRGLVQMGLRRSPHLAAVMVDMATLAVADRPVAVAPTAAGREAGDHSPPNMRATVLQSQDTG